MDAIRESEPQTRPPAGTALGEGTLVDASERQLGNDGAATAPRSASADAEGGTGGPTALLDTIRLEPGSIVPGTRYRIVRWLGTGSMGIVYEAAHVDIERRVALKILRPDEGLSIDATATFRREARTASQIGSPHIIEIVDFAQLPDGRLLFAMELLDGAPLSRLVAQAPVPAARLIPMLRQICKGLAAAHRKGVVHRDIKPDNVMLARKGGREDVVKIVDFGICSLLAGGEAIETAPAGTPFYMAPEQIDGHSYDGRADLYALGCTAYALMTGQPPFVARTLEEVFEAHRHEPPPPPRERRPHANYPPALEAVVLRLLAKTPEDRYADADEVEAALCEAQIEAGIHTAWDDLPLPDIDEPRRHSLARRMPRPERSRRARGWRWPLLAAVAVLVALGLTAVRALSPTIEHPAEPERIEELTLAAKDAATAGYFVYPAADDSARPTAYTRVRELEQLTDREGSDGHARASLLREEFAATLTRLGDDYWERPGGRGFAIDFYAQALVFDPRSERARERGEITFGQITDLSRRAAQAEFTTAELTGARVLRALAAPDETQRLQQLRRVIETTPALPPALGSRLEQLAGDLGGG